MKKTALETFIDVAIAFIQANDPVYPIVTFKLAKKEGSAICVYEGPTRSHDKQT